MAMQQRRAAVRPCGVLQWCWLQPLPPHPPRIPHTTAVCCRAVPTCRCRSSSSSPSPTPPAPPPGPDDGVEHLCTG